MPLEIDPPRPMDIVVVAGMSGAGKTVAIKALEDCGYYPLDHLPANTLPTVLASLLAQGETQVAIGLDVWDPHISEGGLSWCNRFAEFGTPKLILLEADDDALLRRYGETRRRHPLSRDGLPLAGAIAAERAAFASFASLSPQSVRVDTSGMGANTLKAYVKGFMDLKTSQMDICLESFGFKHGTPSACDITFDVRCLPNPYYDKSLRSMSGLDEPVRAFMANHPQPARMAEQIARFISEWKPDYERDHRSYLTIGIGCTGGQHRSVYVAELARELLAAAGVDARCRHRERERWDPGHGAAVAGKPKSKF